MCSDVLIQTLYGVLQVDILGEQDPDDGDAVIDIKPEPEVSLECTESMDFSDDDSLPAPPGTELLSAQLRAREHYIKRSLGIEKIPITQNPKPFVKLEEPKLHANIQPYIARHAAEIIVASENTWYYPPKHLDSLLKKRVPAVVPSQTWSNSFKTINVKDIVSNQIKQKMLVVRLQSHERVLDFVLIISTVKSKCAVSVD